MNLRPIGQKMAELWPKIRMPLYEIIGILTVYGLVCLKKVRDHL